MKKYLMIGIIGLLISLIVLAGCKTVGEATKIKPIVGKDVCPSSCKQEVLGMLNKCENVGESNANTEVTCDELCGKRGKTCIEGKFLWSTEVETPLVGESSLLTCSKKFSETYEFVKGMVPSNHKIRDIEIICVCCSP